MNKNGLVSRLVITTVFAAASVGFVASEIFSKIAYVNAIAQGEYQVSQLNQTISATASIATYLQDEELAKEVVNGLVLNDFIKNAAIKLDNNKRIIAGRVDTEEFKEFTIYSPFEPNVRVGSLLIEPDKHHIQGLAKSSATNNIIAIVGLSISVTLAVAFIAYFLITRSIIKMENELHTLSPGGSERLGVPHLHKLSEIGGLATGVNNLLEKYEYQFVRERVLRNQVESLEKKFRMLFENATSSIVLTDRKGNIILSNQSFKDMIGKIGEVEKQSYGKFLADIFSDGEEYSSRISSGLLNGNSASGDFRLAGRRCSDDLWVHLLVNVSVSDEYDEFYHFTLNDISKRKEYVDQLDHLASHDQLTGLFNRQGAEAKIFSLIGKATHFALILIDLNEFKPINDSYGHAVGDELLVHVSAQLLKSIRKDDICSRWGGDEFVLVLPDISEEDVLIFSRKIYDNIKMPCFVNSCNASLSVSASMGAAMFPRNALTLNELVKLADVEMYAVKSKSCGNLIVNVSAATPANG